MKPQDLVDTARITTNDVGAVLAALGVEAARSTLLTEIGRVFGVYGIGVDARHLNLIADFMMHQVARHLGHATLSRMVAIEPHVLPLHCNSVMVVGSPFASVPLPWPGF